jgi:hypothetical protein
MTVLQLGQVIERCEDLVFLKNSTVWCQRSPLTK